MPTQVFKYKSAFDIMGPIMVGPSSSHTAGAVKIGQAARQLFKKTPERLSITFFGSFAKTYKGHGTDVAIVAGVLGLEENDERIPHAIQLAEEKGVTVDFSTSDSTAEHVNTAALELVDAEQKLTLTGVSIGGGSIEIVSVNNISTVIEAGSGLLLTVDNDRPGLRQHITQLLETSADTEKPALTELHRLGEERIFLVTVPQGITSRALASLRELPEVATCMVLANKGGGGARLFATLEEFIRSAEEKKCTISEVMINQEIEVSGHDYDQVIQRMERNLQAMEAAVRKGIRGVTSLSGITGNDAKRVKAYLDGNNFLTDTTYVKALCYAIATNEVNAAMGTICATPTAGSAGIVPGVLLAFSEKMSMPRDDMIKFLFTAAAFGFVVANNAMISGAMGGCQAETGSASAMAAAALTEMGGGTPRQAGHAFAIALSNLLGLACDPVAGLVEVPCIKRNAGGAGNAISAAELALAGVENEIPADEVIEAMYRVGRKLPIEIRETGIGGLAGTRTGQRLAREIFGTHKKQ